MSDDGRVTGVIDYYYACTDFYAYDLAVSLNAWGFTPGGQPLQPMMRAFADAYHAVRPLSDAEIEALPLFARGSKYRGQPIVLSEVGGFLAIPPDIPPEERDVLYRFYDSFEKPEELVEKYRDLMKGIAQLVFLAGFCYTQLTDIEQEINGLLTYDRQPKVPAEEIARIHHDMLKPGG